MFSVPFLTSRKSSSSRRNRRSARSRTAFEPRRIRLEPLEDRRLLSATIESEWASMIGGDGTDYMYNVTVDGEGNVFATGVFAGVVDFDPGPGITNLNSVGPQDAFVAKYSPSGELLWVRGFGGAAQDRAKGIAVDDARDVDESRYSVYVCGDFDQAVDFDPSNPPNEADTLTTAGSRDLFFLKLSADDGSFQWVRRAGGSDYDDAWNSMDVDKNGNVYAGGYVRGPTAAFGNITVVTGPSATASWFVTKLDASGEFVWVSKQESTEELYLRGRGIAVDDAGDPADWSVVRTGSFGGTVDFGTYENSEDGEPVLTASNSNQFPDLFVLKLNAQNGLVRWVRQTGNAEHAEGSDVAIDDGGNILVTGRFGGIADFDPSTGTYMLPSAGATDVFLLKLDPNGFFNVAEGSFANRFGGIAEDLGNGIGLDPLGNIYLTGSFGDTANFNADPAHSVTSRGGTDAFVAKFDSYGSFIGASTAGGTGDDLGRSVVTDSRQNVYVVGQTDSNEVDFGSDVVGNHGWTDGFLWKLSPPRISVTPISDLTTTEGGGVAQFEVVLTDSPSASVTITFHSSDTSEGIVSPTSLIFTSANWNVPQPVTITGQDDDESDGDVGYTIQFDPVQSADPNFDGIQPRYVTVTNLDDDAAIKTFTNNTPVAIADAKRNPGVTTSQLTIPDEGTIRDLDVQLDITHTYDSNLAVYLVSPAGTEVELFSQVGGSGDNFTSTTLDDDAAIPITAGSAPFTGVYNPEGDLSQFEGGELSGTWTLKVYDTVKGYTGTLNNWSITAVYASPVLNTAPTAANDAYAVNEDGALTVPAPGVLSNDSDADDDPLTAMLVAGPASGSLQFNADGSFIYTPAANFNGDDSFSYAISDGNGGTDSATVSLTIAPDNDAPDAADDTASTVQNASVVIWPLANDSDIDGDALTLSAVDSTSLEGGAITNNPDGSVTYTPPVDFMGTDSFSYTLSDGNDGEDTATVVVTVTRLNHAPFAVNDAFSTEEDTLLVISAPGLLGNDTDADGDPLTAALVTGPANGTLTLNSDGSFSYDPALNFNGTDSFTYQANDTLADSNVATVSITVNSVNDAPVAYDDSATTDEDVAVVVPVLANDTDVDGDSLIVSAVDATSLNGGSVTNNGDGTVTYTPLVGFTGTDTFMYTVSDGKGGTDTATVTITVAPASPTTLHVADLDGTSSSVNRKKWAATVTILVQDAAGSPVSGATITGAWSHGISSTATTGANGLATVLSGNVDKTVGSVTFTVNNIAHATLVYEPAANTDPDLYPAPDSNGTSIVVFQNGTTSAPMQMLAGSTATSSDAWNDDLFAILAADQTAREHGKSRGKSTKLTDLALLELQLAE